MRLSIANTIVVDSDVSAGALARCRSRLSARMSPTWIWMQIAIVVFVLIGMVVAITKLA
jgi:hypothetical protein